MPCSSVCTVVIAVRTAMGYRPAKKTQSSVPARAVRLELVSCSPPGTAQLTECCPFNASQIRSFPHVLQKRSKLLFPISHKNECFRNVLKRLRNRFFGKKFLNTRNGLSIVSPKTNAEPLCLSTGLGNTVDYSGTGDEGSSLLRFSVTGYSYTNFSIVT